MNWIGIDPGILGAIASIKEGEATVLPMPTRNEMDKNGRKKTEYDAREISILLLKWSAEDCFVTIEKLWGVSSKSWASSGAQVNFSLGYAMGIRWLVESLGIQYMIVAPGTWQSELMGPKRKPGKETHISKAQELFPGVPLKRTERCRKLSDGMADALLLAEYGAKTEAHRLLID
jgi:hypothetical protein